MRGNRETNSLNLEPRLEAIMHQEYPRFSDAESARRHKLLDGVMQKAGVDHLLVVTDHRVGNAPQWVTLGRARSRRTWSSSPA